MADEPIQMTLRVQWLQDPTALPSHVNQYTIQAGPGVEGGAAPDVYFLTFANTMPPIVDPNMTPEQAQDFAANTVVLAVPVARLVMSTERLRELHRKLGEVLQAEM